MLGADKNNCPPVSQECKDAMDKLHEAVSRLEVEIKSLGASITGATTSAASLDNKLFEILERKPRQETSAEPVTPPKQIDVSGPTTPEQQSNDMDCDFEEYPATPTLAQIGLSGKTMALVGRGVEISSYSDSEYDTSFYQK